MNEYSPFIDKRLYINWTKELGYGIFSREIIPSHTFIEIAPAVVFEPDDTDSNLMNYVVAWEGKLAVSLGWTMLYNHSDENNWFFSMNYHDRLIAIMTIKEVRSEEQLTVNYGPDWFSSRGINKVNI